MRRHELTEDQWERIKGKLPPERRKTAGRPAKANRGMLNGMLYWLNTGVPWRDLPERYGSWKSVYTRFRRWTEQGVWENLLAALIEEDIVDESTLMLDSTTIKVHQHASGEKKGATKRKPVEAEGGLATKVHVVTDGLGNPLKILLSYGNRDDICMAEPLLESFDLRGKLIIADKGYDSDTLVKWIEERGG